MQVSWLIDSSDLQFCNRTFVFSSEVSFTDPEPESHDEYEHEDELAIAAVDSHKFRVGAIFVLTLITVN